MFKKKEDNYTPRFFVGWKNNRDSVKPNMNLRC